MSDNEKNYGEKIRKLQDDLNKLSDKFKSVEDSYFKVKAAEANWFVVGIIKNCAFFANGIGETVEVPIGILNLLCTKKPLAIDIAEDEEGQLIFETGDSIHATLPPAFIANFPKIIKEWERYWRESQSYSHDSHKTENND